MNIKNNILHKNVFLYSRSNLTLQGTLNYCIGKIIRFNLAINIYCYSVVTFPSLATMKKLNHKWLKIRNYSRSERFRGSHKLKILQFISLFRY